MKDFLRFFGGSILFLAVFMFCVFYAIRVTDQKQCSIYGDVTGRSIKYEFMTCYVKGASGKWYTYEEFKNRMVATGDDK